MRRESPDRNGKLAYFCSMKFTQDVREYAARKKINELTALEVGMKEKAEEFVAGSEIYQTVESSIVVS